MLAERDEQGGEHLGRRREARPLSLPGELCASLGGFSLHAKVALEAEDHAGRERLALAEDGRVVYGLRRHWKDGTRAVAFAPLDFIARLAARREDSLPTQALRGAALQILQAGVVLSGGGLALARGPALLRGDHPPRHALGAIVGFAPQRFGGLKTA